MTDLLLAYITCKDIDEAQKIGKHLMEKRLCACVNIFPQMEPMFYWPPKSGVIQESKEVVLIAKTIESKYAELERSVEQVHSYDNPCIIALPVAHVAESYYKWLKEEMDL